MPHDPAEDRPGLVDIIRRRIEEKGGIPFSEYMELCLYHPRQGYYMTARERIGKGGDFFTSSSVHALFGRLVSRQLAEMAQWLGDGEFTVAEQGAGEGHLALDILDALARENPELYSRLRYRLVEVSEEHRHRQRQRLQAHRDRIDWCALEDLRGMQGCFLSNELVDAFPVHVVEKQGGELQEVFVVHGEEGFGEELRSLSTPELAEYFRMVGVELPEGNRAEVNLCALRWMREVARTLDRGFVLTIDYGYPAPELYAPYRREGSLMCYHRHTVSEDPYQRQGEQDMTSHVDFTALERTGGAEGLDPLWYGPQYRFLMALGYVEELMALQARETDERKAQALRLTLKNLILPEGGMGETFKVLVQGRKVGNPQLLCSRRIGELPLPPANF